MIRFYKDNLVPPELCSMLYEVVPKEYHVPVRFHNRRRKDVHVIPGHNPLGSVRLLRRHEPPSININLNPIYYWASHSGSQSQKSYSATAPSPALWRLLLEVCLHEFGHVATRKEIFSMNRYEYNLGYGRVYDTIEHLANEWRDHRIARILELDPRLGQPRYISGYLGARLVQWRRAVEGTSYYPFIMERRCQMTGGQLTAGDVLRKLHIQHHSYTNAYAVLREASKGIGFDYVDRAGRRHKLYAWGDVPLLAERFDRAKLRERDRERALERQMQTFLQEEAAGILAPRGIFDDSEDEDSEYEGYW